MSALSTLAERVWYGSSRSAAFARTLLTPAEMIYGAVVARRNARFDASRNSSPARPYIPALSVGNLTVGGTGKTPVAAWCVGELRARGARPAIVMRGYGDDEWRVHAILNPGVDVIVSPDRRGALASASSRGADCAVLDDAFQHRQAPRVVDLVLISVDQWTERARLLPAGPYREGLDSLERASVVALTMKGRHDARADDITGVVNAIAPHVPVVRLRLAMHEVRLAVADLLKGGRGASNRRMFVHGHEWLRGKRVIAASAIANATAFEQQLIEHGAEIIVRKRFRDHHRFTSSDAARIATTAQAVDGVICTLKDAVKLAPLWPREAPPLWYVSQTVTVERGGETLEQVFARVLAARRTAVASHIK